MTSYQIRAIRWITVLVVLMIAKVTFADEALNSFSLEKLSSTKATAQGSIRAEQATENLRKMIRANLQENRGRMRLIDREEEAIGYREAVIEVFKNGQEIIHLCHVEKESSFNSGDDACLEKINDLSDRGHLMAAMNSSRGRYVRFNSHPLPTMDQVRALYPLYTSGREEGLIFYMAVSSNGQDPVGLLDPARDFGILGSEWNNTFTHIGAIFLVKLGKKK